MVDLRKYGILLVTLLCLTTTTLSQQLHFVYFQTDNRQPFYVKLNNNVYSSSAAGYLIIPRLPDSTFNLQIGFPKNESPEQSFQFSVKGKDEGYLIKYFNDKGWGLYNLQTMELNMAVAEKKEVQEPKTAMVNDDEFSRTLSEVVSTPDLVKQPVVGSVNKETASADNTLARVATKDKSTIEIRSEQPAVNIEKPRLLMKAGAEMIYFTGEDTVAVFFDGIATKNVMAREASEMPEKNIEKSITKPAETDRTVKEKEAVLKVENKPNVTQCNNIADQRDFLKLRKKMAARTNDFDMIRDAVKTFKTHCFTTVQLRNLSFLFLNNQGLYSFLDAAYPYVADREKFPELKSLLTDEHFRKRFDAMIQQ